MITASIALPRNWRQGDRFFPFDTLSIVSTMYRLCCSVAFVVFISACSSTPSDQPDLAPVEGVVTLDGEPVESASISFQPIDGRRGAQGRTDTQGRYELYYIRAKGCPFGECSVTISTFGDVLDEFGGVQGVNPEKIPSAYRGQDTTLTANVKAGEDNTINFELKSSAGDTKF